MTNESHELVVDAHCCSGLVYQRHAAHRNISFHNRDLPSTINVTSPRTKRPAHHEFHNSTGRVSKLIAVLDVAVAIVTMAPDLGEKDVTMFGRADRKKTGLPEATEGSNVLRETAIGRRPSIDIAHIDDGVDYHLIPKIVDLWPPPANEEEEDLTEAVRSSLRVAITEVLLGHGIKVVEP
jgi:hypothetical protein